MSDNFLSSLPKDGFVKLERLETLDVSRNQLETVSFLPSMSQLDLNRMRCPMARWKKGASTG